MSESGSRLAVREATGDDLEALLALYAELHPDDPTLREAVRRPIYEQILAARVIEHALRHAWSVGCYKVMLLTGSADPGTHAFYRECGFSGTDKHGYVARPDSS